MDGQLQLLKGAEEDQIEQQVIWADSVRWILGWSTTSLLVPVAPEGLSATKVAGEEELRVGIPTVLERNISWVILNVVRKWRDYDYGVHVAAHSEDPGTHSASPAIMVACTEPVFQITGYNGMYRFVLVYTCMNTVCTSMYLNTNQCIPED